MRWYIIFSAFLRDQGCKALLLPTHSLNIFSWNLNLALPAARLIWRAQIKPSNTQGQFSAVHRQTRIFTRNKRRKNSLGTDQVRKTRFLFFAYIGILVRDLNDEQCYRLPYQSVLIWWGAIKSTPPCETLLRSENVSMRNLGHRERRVIRLLWSLSGRRTSPKQSGSH